MPEVTGEGPKLLKPIGRQHNSRQPLITTKECRRASLNRSNIEYMGYSSRRSHSVPSLPAKNKKLRLQFTQTHHIEQNMPSLTSLNFCCNILTLGSEFGLNKMKRWDPIVPFEDCSNTTADPSIVHPFMTTVHPSFSWLFQAG